MMTECDCETCIYSGTDANAEPCVACNDNNEWRPIPSAQQQTHYNSATVQPIEIMQMFATREEFIGFCRCNVIKYTLRAGRKDAVASEIAKVEQYAKWWGMAERGEIVDPRAV